MSIYRRIIDNCPDGTTHVDLQRCMSVPEMKNPYIKFCFRKTRCEWYDRYGDDKLWKMMKEEPCNVISIESLEILARQFPEARAKQ